MPQKFGFSPICDPQDFFQIFLGHAVFMRCQVSIGTVQKQNSIEIVKAIFEIWTKIIKNALKKWLVPPFVTPKDFFQKSGSVTFVPLWCPNFMQKIRKILRAVSAVIMLYDTKNDEKTTKSQKKGSGYYCTAQTRIFQDMRFSRSGRYQ